LGGKGCNLWFILRATGLVVCASVAVGVVSG